jgi:hypothetical protein
MWFIASVVAVLGAACIYNKAEQSSEEIAIFCVAVALVGISLALVAAPWPIHLLMLLAVLLSNRFVDRLFNNG